MIPTNISSCFLFRISSILSRPVWPGLTRFWTQSRKRLWARDVKKTTCTVNWEKKDAQIGPMISYLPDGFCNFLIEVISERAHQDTPSEEARNEAEVSGFLDARIYLYFVHVPFWILKSKWEIPAFLAMLLWTCECFEAFWQFQTERQAAELWKRSVALVGLWVFQKIAFRFAEKSRTFASWWRDAWSMRYFEA